MGGAGQGCHGRVDDRVDRAGIEVPIIVAREKLADFFVESAKITIILHSHADRAWRE